MDLDLDIRTSTRSSVITSETSAWQDIGCSRNSYLIGDGVCDEITNNEMCLYDGGDCCLEDKLTMCQDCSCKLTIDENQLAEIFSQFDVRIVHDADDWFEDYDVEKTVLDVVSVDVCTILCLESNHNDQVNAWTFTIAIRKCQCIRVSEEEICKDEFEMLPVEGNITETATKVLLVAMELGECVNVQTKYQNIVLHQYNKNITLNVLIYERMNFSSKLSEFCISVQMLRFYDVKW